jgi:hypothetical protein
MDNFIEKKINEFDDLCPEFGKWRMDRNLARGFLIKSLTIQREEILNEIDTLWKEYFRNN